MLSENDEHRHLPDVLPDNPMQWADAWLTEATAARVQRNPNSMTIVSVNQDDQPSARVVLCKQFVPDPGYLVFHTNYESQKALDFAANPKAAALFHWDALGRQIRIEGIVVKSPEKESDDYFATRDWGSQLGAWGSDQSRPIESKQALVLQIRQRGANLGLALGSGTDTLLDENIPHIDRPSHWGGFQLWATAVELWLEGPDRIHDRGKWSRELIRAAKNKIATTPWTSTRLQP